MTPSSLSHDQAERYRRDGILFPIRVLDKSEVARFRGAVERLEERLGGRPKPSDMSQPQLHFRWAWELARHGSVVDAVAGLLGPDILVHSASIFSKPPHSGAFVPWHQDGAYWGLERPLLTSAWIALGDSTVQNGCLRVIPGSHRSRTLPYTEGQRSDDSLLASGMEVAVEVDERQAVDVVLEAGEMSLHHVDLIHGSSPNRADTKRVGFAVRYLPPDVPQTLAHHEVVVARGNDPHGHYRHLASPPGDDPDQSLAAMRAFSERWRKFRLGEEA